MGLRRNASTCTKATHKSAKGAWAEVHATGKRNLRPYKCQECRHWHIAHSESPFHDQQEIDRVIQDDANKKSLAEMKTWVAGQPIEVVLLMHDFCHGLMTAIDGNVAPSTHLLQKRHKNAVRAMTHLISPQ